MPEPAVLKVTDIEVHFTKGDSLYFTVDPARGDTIETAEGMRRYQMFPAPGIEDCYIVDVSQVRCLRITTRPATEDAPPQHLGGGIAVSGRLPEPD